MQNKWCVVLSGMQFIVKRIFMQAKGGVLAWFKGVITGGGKKRKLDIKTFWIIT